MVEDLIRIGSMTAEIADLLRAMVGARLNLLVSGGTGSGKTTLLNCLSSFIPNNERIITIEDSAELQLQQPHVVRMETRPPNIEGRGEVTQRELVKNSLRMRPDRIIVGEVRGAECLDMLQAMNTGHDGSISTVHANSARDSLARLEMMMQLSGFDIPVKAMRQQISAALDAIVHTARLADGTRKVLGISEVVGMEGDTIMLQDLFAYQREGKDADGNIVGRFSSTGIRPHFADRLKHSGGEVDGAALAYLK
jgi:pilus assembly protein CpaF